MAGLVTAVVVKKILNIVGMASAVGKIISALAKIAVTMVAKAAYGIGYGALNRGATLALTANPFEGFLKLTLH